MSQKHRKVLFYILVAAAFVSVFIYEYLTPLMSDDLVYLDAVLKARRFSDLFSQELNHYLYHTGRSIAHIILRIFLYIGSDLLFDIVVTIVCITLTLLIYLNVCDRKSYNIRSYALALAFVWFCNPRIADTLFWEDGTCNYLFTTVIIFGMVTVYRLGLLEKISPGKSAVVWMFIWGIFAGWCNENTSGGLILFMAIELIFLVRTKGKSAVRPWMFTGLAGTLIGFVIQIASPANFARSEVTAANHTGIMALFERFLKITNALYEYYIIPIVMVAVILVFLAYLYSDKALFFQKTAPIIFFTFLFFATSYALIMVPFAEPRAYFGGSIFLMIAILTGVEQLIGQRELLFGAIFTAVAVVCGLIFVFTYFEGGANLIRIRRELIERDELFTEMAENGVTEAYVPILSPEWETRFSLAHRVDVKEDPNDWINIIYADHYGFESVMGIDRETWNYYME